LSSKKRHDKKVSQARQGPQHRARRIPQSVRIHEGSAKNLALCKQFLASGRMQRRILRPIFQAGWRSCAPMISRGHPRGTGLFLAAISGSYVNVVGSIPAALLFIFGAATNISGCDTFRSVAGHTF